MLNNKYGDLNWFEVHKPLLPNNVGKKSVNDAGPQQGCS